MWKFTCYISITIAIASLLFFSKRDIKISVKTIQSRNFRARASFYAATTWQSKMPQWEMSKVWQKKEQLNSQWKNISIIHCTYMPLCSSISNSIFISPGVHMPFLDSLFPSMFFLLVSWILQSLKFRYTYLKIQIFIQLWGRMHNIWHFSY